VATRNDSDTQTDDNVEELEEEIQEKPASKVSKDDDERLTLAEKRARRRSRKRGETISGEISTAGEAGAITEKKNRPTPSSRGKARVQHKQDPAIIRFLRGVPLLGGTLASMANYFRNVYAEMLKVTWPSRQETNRLTWMVITVTAIFAVSLGAIDLFYGWWFRQGLDDEVLFLGIAAGFLVFIALIGVLYRRGQTAY
jgi:preprotein translocase subunit SecE